MAASLVLLVWALGGSASAMWAEGASPGWGLVPAVFAVLFLAAAVAIALGRVPALTVVAEGVRANLRLHRWEEIEALELGGTTACPALKLRIRRRRRPAGTVGQESVRGDLVAWAHRVQAEAGVPVVGAPKPSRRRRPSSFVIALGFTLVLVLCDWQFLPGLWVQAPGTTADAYGRLRPPPASEPRGEVRVLSVRDQPATVLDLVRFLRGDEAVHLDWYNPFRPERGPPTDDASAVRSAVAAGLACAGRPVEVHGGRPEVILVRDDSPAKGQLYVHDRIVSVAGSPVRFKEDVFATLVGWDTTRPVSLLVEGADGRQRTEMVPVTRGRYGAWVLAGVGIGRLPTTLEGTTRTFDFHDFEGDSSGLAAAVTVFDVETPGVLISPGTTVAMTGSVSPAGAVGPVAGIPEKVAAAKQVGASTVLVPAELGQSAARAAGAGLRVVGVRTLNEAVRALGGAGCR